MTWRNDQWSRERGPAQLSREQFEAGAPCPGCGRPYLPEQWPVPHFWGLEIEALKGLERGDKADPTWANALVRRDLVVPVGDEYSITSAGHEALGAYRDDQQWLEQHRATHPAIHSHSHMVEGGPSHCGLCCPPRPLSLVQLEKIAAIMRTAQRYPVASAPVASPKPKRPTRRELEARVAELEAKLGQKAEE